MEKRNNQEIHRENAEEICRKIKEDADREIKETLERAKKAAAITLGEARLEAERRRQELLKEFDKESQLLKERIFSTINLERKRIILEEKNRLIEDVFEKVKKEAETFRGNKDYRNFLKRAILEGIDIIDTENIDILYSFLDENIIAGGFMDDIKSICRTKGNGNVSLQIKKSDFKDIGVIAQSRDGHLIYDNRFLARLQRAYDGLYLGLLKEIK